jgi:Uma2 family endonuclease
MAIAQLQHLEWQEEVPAVEPCKRLLTVEEYHRMGEVGIFARNERVELIRGEIYKMTPIGNRHATSVRRLVHFFHQRFGAHALLDVQNPVLFPEQASEPQPDVVLLRYQEDFYGSGHPQPKDVLLLVEVAESSTVYDRKLKLPLYAQSGIAEFWLVDLKKARIWVHRHPTPEGYRKVQEYRRGEEVSPEAFPDERFAVDEILG